MHRKNKAKKKKGQSFSFPAFLCFSLRSHISVKLVFNDIKVHLLQ